MISQYIIDTWSSTGSHDAGLSKDRWRRYLAFIYLGSLSILVLWWAKPPLRTLHQLRLPKTTSLIDDRYRELLLVLPPDPKLGYISDVEEEAKKTGSEEDKAKQIKLHYQSQYALAPRVIEHSTRPRYVIADLDDASRLGSLCRLYSLRPLAIFRNGVALLEHEPKP
jgi:hypothetical protein